MCADRVRVGAYARAIRAVVRPDDVVLDLGCGLGVLTVLAARAGARRVFAVDVDDSVHYARRVAVDNGVADRVTFFRGRMEEVDLPERPTVIVGDLHGALPLTAGTSAAWNAARAQAASDARTIPLSDVVVGQPVRSNSLHSRLREPLVVEEVSLASLRSSLLNGFERDDRDVEEAAALAPLFEIRYDRPLGEDLAGRATFVTSKPRTVDAFRVGFETRLAPGVELRSFGEGGARIYGPLIAPTIERLRWEPAVPLGFRFERRRVSNGAEFLWAVDVGGKESPGKAGWWRRDSPSTCCTPACRTTSHARPSPTRSTGRCSRASATVARSPRR